MVFPTSRPVVCSCEVAPEVQAAVLGHETSQVSAGQVLGDTDAGSGSDVVVVACEEVFGDLEAVMDRRLVTGGDGWLEGSCPDNLGHVAVGVERWCVGAVIVDPLDVGLSLGELLGQVGGKVV